MDQDLADLDIKEEAIILVNGTLENFISITNQKLQQHCSVTNKSAPSAPHRPRGTNMVLSRRFTLIRSYRKRITYTAR